MEKTFELESCLKNTINDFIPKDPSFMAVGGFFVKDFGDRPFDKILFGYCHEGHIDMVKYFLPREASLNKQCMYCSLVADRFDIAKYIKETYPSKVNDLMYDYKLRNPLMWSNPAYRAGRSILAPLAASSNDIFMLGYFFPFFELNRITSVIIAAGIHGYTDVLDYLFSIKEAEQIAKNINIDCISDVVLRKGHKKFMDKLNLLLKDYGRE